MKKILYIHHAAGWGGASKSLITLINSLDNNEYQCQVLMFKKSEVCEYFDEYGIDYFLAKSKFYKSYYNYFTHSEAGYVRWSQAVKFFKLSICWFLSRSIFAEKELEKFDFDIVHLNSSALTDWLKPCSKKSKTIIHVREPFRRGKMDLLHYFFRNQMRKYADRVIAISSDNAQRINLQKKTVVIYNYADILEKTTTSVTYRSKKFLYLGGSAKIKGFDILVQALDFIEKDIKIYFGGSYASLNKKRVLIKRILRFFLRYGVKQRKSIEKMKQHPQAVEIGLVHDVSEFLDEICCVISPFSSPHFARPVIEAYLHQKPAIGSSVSGMDEIILHGVTGLIFPKDNAEELASAINYLANNSGKAKMMGTNGKAIAIEKFSSKNIEQFHKLYRTLSM